jgi:hypothetical protein
MPSISYSVRLRAVTAVLITASAFATMAALSASAATKDTANAACQAIMPIAREYGTISGIVRSEASTAALVADWQERRHPNRSGIVSGYRGIAGARAVTVCLFAGQFVTPVGPPNEDGSQNPPHTVLRLLVADDGTVVLDAAGYPGRLDPETPGDFISRNP